MNRILLLLLLLTASSHVCLGASRQAEMPRLQRQGDARQLIVDGRPFLMRGGEFSNNVYEAPKDLQGLKDMLDAYLAWISMRDIRLTMAG